MKKLVIMLVASISLFFVSCKNEVSEPISSKSSDGEMTITVQGKRSSMLDPFHVDVVVDIKDKKIESFIEVYSDEITSNNVNFLWNDDRNCLVIFTQRDETTVSIPISIEE